MDATRRTYSLSVEVNGVRIDQIQIDPHYLLKHEESVNDQVILELVKKLHGETVSPKKTKDGFDYFVNDPIWLGADPYRLIWLMPEDRSFLGVINAFRVDRPKEGEKNG